MNCSTPDLPVHQQLPKLTQTHVHWVNDAIQPSHSLSSPSPSPFNLSQHQGLFQWVSSLHQRWTKYWSFSISPPNDILGWFPLGLTGLISLLSQGLSRVFSSTTAGKHLLFGAQSSLRSNFNIGQYKVINYKRIYVLFCPSLFFSHHHRHSQDCDRQPLWSLSSLLISHLSRKNAHREIMYLL